MRIFIFSIAFIFVLGRAFGQSTLIEPNSNNGILSKNASTVFSDPGVVALPLSGAGTRLMWIPAKTAFRVGTVTGTQWDAANVGTWSFGTGYDNIASGAWSFAAGYATTASNTYSTAFGNNTKATGSIATALGFLTTASGDASTALGEGTISKAYRSMAIGYYNDPISTSNLSLNISTDPLFIIGNGTSTNNRSNALMVLKNGNVGIGVDLPFAKLTVNATGNTSAGDFSTYNSLNTSSVIYSETYGKGNAGYFNVNNISNTNHAIHANTNGIGSAIYGANLGNTGGAADFYINSASNSSDVVSISTNGSGSGINSINFGTGLAGIFQNNNLTNTSPALNASSTGLGQAGIFDLSNNANSANALSASTSGTGHGIHATSYSGIGGYFSSTNGYALITGNGKAGIGTSTPAEKLTVQTASGNYGLLHTSGTVSIGTFVNDAFGGYFGTKSNHPLLFFTNSGAVQMTLTTDGKVGIGVSTVSTNEILEVNGRMRLRRGAFASGLWFNNTSNGTSLNDGAFIGLNGETSGSETVGFYLNGGFRFLVDRAGNTTQNSVTASNLAGTGNRIITADPNGNLTTTSPSPQTYTMSISPQAFQPTNSSSGTFISIGTYSECYLVSGSSGSIVAPVTLPNGATITSVTVYYINTDNTKKMYLALFQNYLSAATDGIYFTYSSNISASISSVVSTSLGRTNLGSNIIDNNTSSYHLTISPITISGNSTSWSANMGIKGVKINYTL